jgi:hypothetical protein
MTELNRQTVQSIHSEIQDLLAPLQEKYGITISLGNVRYDSSELRTKLTARVGKATPRLSKNDFNVGDIVGIKSPKVDPNDQFEVIKINNKNIVVKGLDGLGSMDRKYNVSPGLLIKK